MESHLLQMRGLKQILHENISLKWQVASFTDAWIETHLGGGGNPTKCRIFYRCVD